MNLSNIRIPCADLSSACLENTNFTHSDLKYVVFDKAYCAGTKFNKSNMIGVRFDVDVKQNATF
jgi:uncharacterized protein YjbI with pentapeptide repeats